LPSGARMKGPVNTVHDHDPVVAMDPQSRVA